MTVPAPTISPRRILVTGGSRGIGKAIALAFAALGDQVLITGRDTAALAAVTAAAEALPGNVAWVATDVGQPEALSAALMPWLAGSADVVVANAGISGRTAVDGAPDTDVRFAELIHVNLTGTWHTLQLTLPHLRTGGRVILMGSDLSRMGAAGYAGYAASKHGLLGLMWALSPTLAERQITINTVCPGWVDTDMAAESLTAIADELGLPVDEVRLAEAEAMPLGRFLRADEVAELVIYLAGPHAGAITGQTFGIDAGTTAFA